MKEKLINTMLIKAKERDFCAELMYKGEKQVPSNFLNYAKTKFTTKSLRITKKEFGCLQIVTKDLKNI